MQELSLRLTYRCEVLIAVETAVSTKESLTVTFRKTVQGLGTTVCKSRKQVLCVFGTRACIVNAECRSVSETLKTGACILCGATVDNRYYHPSYSKDIVFMRLLSISCWVFI